MRKALGYRSGGSILHRLHPLLKLAWVVFLTAAVFLFKDPVLLLGLSLALGLVFPLIGIRFRDLPGLRFLLAASALILVLQLVFWQEGPELVRLGAFSITSAGLGRGLYLGSRFITVVLVSYLFVLTTSPNQLAYALMRAGLPYRYGFTFVTALRLVPIFEEEIRTVHRAQLVRGVSFGSGRWKDFWRNLTGFTLPMLVSAMGKVDALSISMEGRCFGMYPTRTYFKTRARFKGDLWAGLSLLLAVVLVLWIRN